MKVEGYVDFSLTEIKEILREYVEKMGYEATEVYIPEQISATSIISISIEVKPDQSIRHPAFQPPEDRVIKEGSLPKPPKNFQS